jgi:DNA-binding transcriptional LysR family regulator
MIAMDLDQLRALQAVAETTSFTKAAGRLHLTQSAVSQRIKQLEDELGETLFVRSRRGVRLSDGGSATLVHARRILEEVEALQARVAGSASAATGRVRAAAATQAFGHLFAPLFEAFMREHPGIELTFRSTVSTDQTVADIVAGAADVGFASLPVYSPSLEVAELFVDELKLVVGRRHALARRDSAAPGELSRERFILFERGNSVRRTTDAFFQKVGLRPELALESNDTTFIKHMVAVGIGVSLLPEWAVREELGRGRLTTLAVRGHALRRTVAVVSPARFRPAATRTFLEYVVARRADLQAAASARPPGNARRS